jgi:hypothetical protein
MESLHSPARALVKTSAAWAVRIVAFLVAILLAPTPILILGLLQDGMSLAALWAAVLVVGLSVGLPIGIVGLLYLEVTRLRHPISQIGLALATGLLVAAVAWLGGTLSSHSAPELVRPFLIGAIAIAVFMGVHRFSIIRSDLALGVVVGLASAAAGLFYLFGGIDPIRVSSIAIAAGLGTALGALSTWIYGFPATWLRQVIERDQFETTLTAEERLRFGSRLERETW